MAYPQIASSATTVATTSSTGLDINMPSGITAGDLLIAMVANDTGVSWGTVSGGWDIITNTTSSTAVQGSAWAKIAAGSDTMNITGEANDIAVIVVRITGHGVSDVTVDIARQTAATGTDSNPNPPNCNPAVSKEYLWLAWFAADDDDIADPDTGYTAYPSGYTGIVAKRSATGTSSCCVAAGYKQSTASSEDPGTFTMTASEEWVAQTYGIPPLTDVSVSATTDALTLSTKTATVNYDISVSATADALTLATYAATVTEELVVSANTASLVLAENAATVTYDVTVSANTDGLVLATNSATVVYEIDVAASTDALTLATQAATIAYDVTVSANAESLTLATNGATVSYEIEVQANASGLTLVANAASIGIDINVSAAAKALTLLPRAATVDYVDSSVTVSAGSKSLSLGTHAAYVVAGGTTVYLWQRVA